MPSGYIKDLEGNRIEIVDAQARSGLQGKQDKLTAGSNISISNNIISADDTTVTQTITSGTEIGRVNETSLFAPTVNYVDAGTNANGDIVFYGGNAESANITQAVQLAKTELQTSIGEKYTKPSGGIPETDLSEDIQKKIDGDVWELIYSTTLQEDLSRYTQTFETPIKKFYCYIEGPSGEVAMANQNIAIGVNSIGGTPWSTNMYKFVLESDGTFMNTRYGIATSQWNNTSISNLRFPIMSSDGIKFDINKFYVGNNIVAGSKIKVWIVR